MDTQKKKNFFKRGGTNGEDEYSFFCAAFSFTRKKNN